MNLMKRIDLFCLEQSHFKKKTPVKIRLQATDWHINEIQINFFFLPMLFNPGVFNLKSDEE